MHDVLNYYKLKPSTKSLYAMEPYFLKKYYTIKKVTVHKLCKILEKCFNIYQSKGFFAFFFMSKYAMGISNRLQQIKY